MTRLAQDSTSKVMPLARHLRELRRRLATSAGAILGVAILGFFIAPAVIAILQVPISEIAESRNASITFTTVTGAFDLRLQIAIMIGVVGSSPIWLYQVFAFVVPALKRRERRYTFGFFFSAVPLFIAGAASGALMFPHMVQLLAAFAPTESATLLEARTYYDFVIKLVLAVGIAFVLPVFVVLLNFMGVMSASTIIRGWRIAVLLIATFAAFATPAADVVSMFLLAVPMTLLYLLAALIARIHDRRLERRLRDA